MAESTVNVSPEDLWISGAMADGHAMDLSEAHASADVRIESALPYIPALAAAAMQAKAEEWQATTATLTGNLASHATALRASATSYVESDESNADMIRQVGVDESAIYLQ